MVPRFGEGALAISSDTVSSEQLASNPPRRRSSLRGEKNRPLVLLTLTLAAARSFLRLEKCCCGLSGSKREDIHCSPYCWSDSTLALRRARSIYLPVREVELCARRHRWVSCLVAARRALIEVELLVSLPAGLSAAHLPLPFVPIISTRDKIPALVLQLPSLSHSKNSSTPLLHGRKRQRDRCVALTLPSYASLCAVLCSILEPVHAPPRCARRCLACVSALASWRPHAAPEQGKGKDPWICLGNKRSFHDPKAPEHTRRRFYMGRGLRLSSGLTTRRQLVGA